MFKIRTHLQEWAQENNFYIKVSMNSIAKRVIDDNMRLLGETPVKINNRDVEEINLRCDTDQERIFALGILCYAKEYADKDGKFNLSNSGFSKWISQYVGLKVSDYIHMFIMLEYIEIVKKTNTNSWYHKDVVKSLNTYKILVPFKNTGKYTLVDNNLGKLFDELFSDIDTDSEKWCNIEGYNDWYQISNMKRIRVKERQGTDGRIHSAQILSLSKGGKSVKLRDSDRKQHNIRVDRLFEKYWNLDKATVDSLKNDIFTNPDEKWVFIDDDENYKISSFGRVYNCRKERLCQQSDTINGYCNVKLSLNGKKSKTYLVHRLVAQTFISNPDNKPEVNHRDNNPHNNRVDNLEWCTRSENIQHALRYGDFQDVIGNLHSKEANDKRAETNRMDIDIYNKDNILIESVKGLKKASEITGLALNTISTCLQDGRTTRNGYRFIRRY